MNELSVGATARIGDAIACIDRSGRIGLALLVDEEGRFISTLTDGDVRRGIVAGLKLDDPVSDLLPIKQKTPNPVPLTAPAGASQEQLLQMMRERGVRQIPIIDRAGKVVDVATMDGGAPTGMQTLRKDELYCRHCGNRITDPVPLSTFVASRAIPKTIDWAEAYTGDLLLVVRGSERMAYYYEALPTLFPVEFLGSFAAFLNRLGPLVRGRQVIVSLGDSNAAGARVTWPRVIAQEVAAARGELGSIVVINMADVDNIADQQTSRLEQILAWRGLDQATDVSVVYAGGLVDVWRRWVYFDDFAQGRRPTPFLESELELAKHPHGTEFIGLLRDIPSDRSDVERWYVKRAIASLKVLEGVSSDAHRPFFAVLNALCYPDLAPAYRAELERLHRESNLGLTLAAWCKRNKYATDADDRFGLKLRPALETLRSAWRRQSAKNGHGVYADYAALFAERTENCFVPFEALHLSERGIFLLAWSILSMVRSRDTAIAPLPALSAG